MLFLARNFINTILVLQCETVNRICQNFSFRAPFSNESVSLFSIHCPLTENFAGIRAANANVNYRTQWILNSKCGYSGSKDKPDAWVSCSGFVLNRLWVQTLRTVRFTSDRIIPLLEYWLNWRPPKRADFEFQKNCSFFEKFKRSPSFLFIFWRLPGSILLKKKVSN